jgi:hypothetical protein
MQFYTPEGIRDYAIDYPSNIIIQGKTPGPSFCPNDLTAH